MIIGNSLAYYLRRKLGRKTSIVKIYKDKACGVAPHVGKNKRIWVGARWLRKEYPAEYLVAALTEGVIDIDSKLAVELVRKIELPLFAKHHDPR